jgi:hypothetical protein
MWPIDSAEFRITDCGGSCRWPISEIRQSQSPGHTERSRTAGDEHGIAAIRGAWQPEAGVALTVKTTGAIRTVRTKRIIEEVKSHGLQPHRSRDYSHCSYRRFRGPGACAKGPLITLPKRMGRIMSTPDTSQISFDKAGARTFLPEAAY